MQRRMPDRRQGFIHYICNNVPAICYLPKHKESTQLYQCTMPACPSHKLWPTMLYCLYRVFPSTFRQNEISYATPRKEEEKIHLKSGKLATI